jgi:hypothetical protein
MNLAAMLNSWAFQASTISKNSFKGKKSVTSVALFFCLYFALQRINAALIKDKTETKTLENAANAI